MSTAHEDREAFALLDDAIEALFAIARDPDRNPNDVPIDAVLIVGVPAVDNAGDRMGHVEVYPRTGSQPADVRGLISAAGKLLDRALDDGDDKPSPRPGGVLPTPAHAATRGNGEMPPLTPRKKTPRGSRK